MSSRGQSGVKLVRKALGPNLAPWLEPLTKVYCMNWWSQKSYSGQPSSTRGKIVQECPMATKFGRKNQFLKCSVLIGSKVMQG